MAVSQLVTLGAGSAPGDDLEEHVFAGMGHERDAPAIIIVAFCPILFFVRYCFMASFYILRYAASVPGGSER